MFEISWYYLYGVGGAFYALGSYVCIRSGSLDLSQQQDRTIYAAATGCLVVFAAAHALFQFVLPHGG